MFETTEGGELTLTAESFNSIDPRIESSAASARKSFLFGPSRASTLLAQQRGDMLNFAYYMAVRALEEISRACSIVPKSWKPLSVKGTNGVTNLMLTSLTKILTSCILNAMKGCPVPIPVQIAQSNASLRLFVALPADLALLRYFTRNLQKVGDMGLTIQPRIMSPSRGSVVLNTVCGNEVHLTDQAFLFEVAIPIGSTSSGMTSGPIRQIHAFSKVVEMIRKMTQTMSRRMVTPNGEFGIPSRFNVCANTFEDSLFDTLPRMLRTIAARVPHLAEDSALFNALPESARSVYFSYRYIKSKGPESSEPGVPTGEGFSWKSI